MVALTSFLASVVAATGPGNTELTIYNQGFALVKEVRTMSLQQGRHSVSIEDVAAQIDPTSVSIRSLGAKDAFSVLEQNYQYDLIGTQAILNKSVGQKIRFIRTIGKQRDVLSGTLLSSPTAIVGNPQGGSQQTYNGMVIRTDDNRIVLDPTGEVEVSSIPAGLISRPTLMWDLQSRKTGSENIELSYISRGISWSADYVLTLGSTGKGDIQGWVTLDNKSGATWENAKLKLLAGEIHQNLGNDKFDANLIDGLPAAVNKPAFNEESIFEYHLYTLQRPATVRNNETKQLTLLEGHGFPLKKKLIVDSIGSSYYPSEGEVGTGDIKPQVRLEFVNRIEDGLGMPLPKGRVRVYQRDQSGSVQLLGEDQIDHTPRNEKLSLVMGRSFDITSTRKRLNFTRVSAHSVRETFEIEVRNRKSTPESVFVMERHYGDWRITAKSQEFTKLDSDTAQFLVELKPNEVKKVTYTVLTKW